jgi:serine/threonine protein kinase
MKNTTPQEAENYPVGTLVAGRYEVQQLLGWGSAGTVLKVKDIALNGEIVALKVLSKQSAQDETTCARLRREVILARKLTHPNIVKVFDTGKTEQGDPFVSMEFVDGITLHQAIEMGHLSREEALEHLQGIVDGLSSAHEHNIIHRDIKPANVMITKEGIAKIADFGTAYSSDSNEKLTMPDELVGTPLFVAPEIITKGRADMRSDVYSLGALAYTMIEGEPPLFHPNWTVLAHMHVSMPPPHLDPSKAPAWYDQMVQRCMAKDPSTRFQSATELQSFLERCIGRDRASPSRTGLLIAIVALAALGTVAISRFIF